LHLRIVQVQFAVAGNDILTSVSNQLGPASLSDRAGGENLIGTR